MTNIPVPRQRPYLLAVKGTFSDSIILQHREHKSIRKANFQNFSWPIFFKQVMHDIDVTFHWFIDYCVELIIVNTNFCDNCHHFILICFEPEVSWGNELHKTELQTDAKNCL